MKNKTIVCEYIAELDFWYISVNGRTVYECVASDEVLGLVKELMI